ncbi:MAG: 4Fe-4S binding protein, partial [Promethearchaeota archaeon]
TSTHKVYKIIIDYNTLDENFIYQKMLELGHKRRLSDIRAMIKLLKHFDLTNPKLIKVVNILRNCNAEKPNEALVHVANEFVNEMMERGLLIKPFLEAVDAFPNNNKIIQYEIVDRAKKYGFYDQRIGDDISAAMRNFTSFLNLTAPPTRRGVYELTNLGKKVVSEKEMTFKRIICEANEPCRRVCPTGAISATRINQNCIACGLCVDSCPYGALTLDCNTIPRLKLNQEVCIKSRGKSVNAVVCDINKIQAEELILQRWIKQVFGIVGIKAEIPGVGEYPDLVTLEEPSFVEVKKERITRKKRETIMKQVIRYTTEEVVSKTIKQLKRFSNYDWKKPDYFTIIARKGGEERELLKELKENIYDKEFGFISINKLYKLTDKFFKIIKEKRFPLSLINLYEIN